MNAMNQTSTLSSFKGIPLLDALLGDRFTGVKKY